MFLEKILETKEAKEAIGTGVVELIMFGNLNRAIDSTIKKGNQNGSLPVAKLAFVLDLIRNYFRYNLK